jgi:hemerythrin-like domain-containing protein
MSPTTSPTRPGTLLVPGQCAAHDGPVDLTVMYVVHHAFRRDLGAFAEAAQRTPVADRATWQALARRWEFFSTVLHHHHSGEDAGLWPLLLQRVDAAGDAAGRATLEAMEAEHADIDPLLEACTAGFARLAEAADDDTRAALAVRLVAAREHLTRHLRHEETDALRLVQQHLTQEDWKRLDEEHFKAKYGFRETLGLVGWVLHGLPATTVKQLRRNPETRPLVILGRLLAVRGFERRKQVAFRYLA